MVQIANANDVVTLINIFTVSPENQQKLVDMLIAATKTTMRHVPGFVSASIHKRVRARARQSCSRCSREIPSFDRLPVEVLRRP